MLCSLKGSSVKPKTQKQTTACQQEVPEYGTDMKKLSSFHLSVNSSNGGL